LKKGLVELGWPPRLGASKRPKEIGVGCGVIRTKGPIKGVAGDGRGTVGG